MQCTPFWKVDIEMGNFCAYIITTSPQIMPPKRGLPIHTNSITQPLHTVHTGHVSATFSVSTYHQGNNLRCFFLGGLKLGGGGVWNWSLEMKEIFGIRSLAVAS